MNSLSSVLHCNHIWDYIYDTAAVWYIMYIRGYQYKMIAYVGCSLPGFDRFILVIDTCITAFNSAIKLRRRHAGGSIKDCARNIPTESKSHNPFKVLVRTEAQTIHITILVLMHDTPWRRVVLRLNVLLVSYLAIYVKQWWIDVNTNSSFWYFRPLIWYVAWIESVGEYRIWSQNISVSWYICLAITIMLSQIHLTVPTLHIPQRN